MMADDPLAAIRERNGMLIKRVYAPYALLGVAILLLAPEGILGRIPLLGSLTSWAGTWIPSIERYAAVSPFPDATRLFIVAMSAGFPFAVYQFARHWTFPDRMSDLRRFDQWFVVGSLLMIALISGFFVWVFLDVPRENILQAGGRGGPVVRMLTQYRLGMAVVASILFCATAVSTGGAINLACRIVRSRGRR